MPIRVSTPPFSSPLVDVKIGWFWDRIRENWKNQGKQRTCLSGEQKERVEKAVWFNAALSKMKKKWGKKS